MSVSKQLRTIQKSNINDVQPAISGLAGRQKQ